MPPQACQLLKDWMAELYMLWNYLVDFDGDRLHLRKMSFTILKKLLPPATKLAQIVSQRIEHCGLDDLDEIELRLRLAEFEAVLLAAQELTQNG